VKFPFVFKKNHNGMKDETQNTIPDLTDIDELRKAIIAAEILNRKY